MDGYPKDLNKIPAINSMNDPYYKIKLISFKVRLREKTDVEVAHLLKPAGTGNGPCLRAR